MIQRNNPRDAGFNIDHGGEPHFAGVHRRRSLIRISRRRTQDLGEAPPLTQVNARYRRNTYE